MWRHESDQAFIVTAVFTICCALHAYAYSFLLQPIKKTCPARCSLPDHSILIQEQHRFSIPRFASAAEQWQWLLCGDQMNRDADGPWKTEKASTQGKLGGIQRMWASHYPHLPTARLDKALYADALLGFSHVLIRFALFGALSGLFHLPPCSL